MYPHILLSVDLGQPESQRKAVEVAVAQAKAFGSVLHVVTVVPDFGLSIVGGFFPKDQEQLALEHARKALHDYTAEHIPAGIQVQHIVGHGRPYEEILRYARELGIDLIVMASHHPGLQDYLLGPNSARVVRHAACSVLVVRD
ncbi:MAG: universal stress protein [Tistlia sp.]|uniref:universal stress protein n=1 Tax=Tistlia sp. TaxID=3057121 RepID=UPI0034A4C8B2